MVEFSGSNDTLFYIVLCRVLMNLCDFLVPLTSFGPWQSHLGPPSAPSLPKVAIFDDIWCHFGVILELTQALRIRSVFFIDSGVYPNALRRVLAAAGALFSLWRPVANNIEFWFHFEEILGDNSSTILTLGSA